MKNNTPPSNVGGEKQAPLSDAYQTRPVRVRAFFYDGVDPHPLIKWFAEEHDILWTVRRGRLLCDQLGTFWPLDVPTWFVVDLAYSLGDPLKVYSPDEFASRFERVGGES